MSKKAELTKLIYDALVYTAGTSYWQMTEEVETRLQQWLAERNLALTGDGLKRIRSEK